MKVQTPRVWDCESLFVVGIYIIQFHCQQVAYKEKWNLREFKTLCMDYLNVLEYLHRILKN
jgi:hypothetical protein